MSSIDKIEELLDKKIGDLATKESIGEIRKLLLEQREKLDHQEEMIKGLKDELSSQDKIIKMESTVAILNGFKNCVTLKIYKILQFFRKCAIFVVYFS